MWLMAKRKVENWIFWIMGCNFNSTIFSKGFTFTSFQYIVFTIVAIFWLFRMEENLRQLPNGTQK
jgi:nicotinamide mononucleotide transporter